MALADIRLVQTYYALRQSVGPDGQKPFKSQFLSFIIDTRRKCGLPPVAPTQDQGAIPVPPSAAECVVSAFESQRGALFGRLNGPAAEEASRAPAENAALQAKLQALGFLPQDAVVDGVFGTGTRSALLSWQHRMARPETGFFSNSDAAVLSAAATVSPLAANDRVTSQRLPSNEIATSQGKPLTLGDGLVLGGATAIDHVGLAFNAMRSARRKLSASRTDAAIAYANMRYLEMQARMRLGCGNTTDSVCMGNTAAAILATTDTGARGQWQALEIAETLRETAGDFDETRLDESWRDIGALQAMLTVNTDTSAPIVSAQFRKTEVSVALAAEIDGAMMRKWDADIETYMSETQVAFQGALASVTDPGRRSAASIDGAVDDLAQAEAELDLVAAGVSLPSGHILLHTSD